RMLPLPGSASPRASHREFMEFAVNMPEQEPHPGHPMVSSSFSCSSSMRPALYAPTPSNTDTRSMARSWPFMEMRPAAMGPPLMKMVGMLTRKAPMSMPGVILSQLGMQIMPSNQWAAATVSTASAMISRLGREYRIPM